MNVLRFFFGLCGNATALFLFLAPVVTFKRILKNKSTEQFSGLPYVTTFLNNLFAAWYGLPFVSPNNILVTTINATGAVIETIYILIFLTYAPKKERIKIGGLFVFMIILFTTIATTSLLTFQGTTRKLLCGLAATIATIIMYASPLSVTRTVITTKSVEYMPFLLSLFFFLCGTSWFIFGLLGHDPFVAVPNGFGCGLGAMQLILYLIYRCKNKKPGSGLSKDKTTADKALHMGLEKPHQTLKEAKSDYGTTIGGHNG